MEVLLIGVTLVSLAIATTMTVVAWKLLRDGRARSMARTEALSLLAREVAHHDLTGGDRATEDGIDDVDDELDPIHDTRPSAAISSRSEPPAAPTRALARPSPERRGVPPAPRPAPAPTPPTPLRHTPLLDLDGRAFDEDDTTDDDAVDDDSDLRRDQTPAHGVARAEDTASLPASLFAATSARPSRVRLGLSLAAVVLFVMAGAAMVYAVRQSTAFGNGAPTPAAGTAQPLELLALRHSSDDPGQFTVSGIVEEPANGRALDGVVAVVFLFDADGRTLATGRGALALPKLRPGEQAPFVVTVAVRGDVSRYRVGFRYEDGKIVSHVDRRSAAPTVSGAPPAAPASEPAPEPAPANAPASTSTTTPETTPAPALTPTPAPGHVTGANSSRDARSVSGA